MTPRRFDDEEVSLILRRALEADERRSDDGLTLEQLKAVAAEVGIDTARVEEAALHVRAERMVPAGRRSRLTARYEVVVEGALDPERRAEMLRSIRRSLGRQGIVTEELGGLQWKARDSFGGRYVTVRSSEGHTRVEALGNFRDGAAVVGVSGGILGFTGTSLLLKATVGGIASAGVLGPAALLAGAVLPAWGVYRFLFAREDAALRRAVSDVAAQVHDGADDRSSGSPDLPPSTASS